MIENGLFHDDRETIRRKVEVKRPWLTRYLCELSMSVAIEVQETNPEDEVNVFVN